MDAPVGRTAFADDNSGKRRKGVAGAGSDRPIDGLAPRTGGGKRTARGLYQDDVDETMCVLQHDDRCRSFFMQKH